MIHMAVSFLSPLSRAPYVYLKNEKMTDMTRFSTDVQPSALFVELEDAAASAAAAAVAAEGVGGRGPTAGGDDRPRIALVGGFCFGLDTRHVEDAPGVAVIKRHPGGLEPTKRRPLQSQLQVQQ